MRPAELGAMQGALLAAAAALLGLAVHVNDGAFDTPAIVLLALALAATIAVFVPRVAAIPFRHLVPVVAALAIVELGIVALRPIARGFPVEGDGLAPFVAGVACATALVAAIAWGPERWIRVEIGALIAIFLLLGVWVLRQAQPVIDVYIFQQGAARALVHGRNPWALRYTNPYPSDSFYGPGLVVNGKLQFGYPYPLLPLLMVLPSWLVTADVRYAHVVALAAAGALIAFARPGRIAPLAAALLLFSPRVFFTLLLGWVEPLVLILFALVVFVAIRRPKVLAYAFGLFLAVKQYLVFAVPLVLLIVPRGRPTLRVLVVASVVVIALTIPALAWNAEAFIHSVVTLQFHQPFRRDALAFPALLTALGGPEIGWLAFAVTPITVGVVYRRSPRTAAGFAAAMAITYFVFFAFNKQAFCNYYMFVIGALCAGVAAIDFTPAPAETPT